MLDRLRLHMNTRTPLSATEFRLASRFFSPKLIPKKQFFLREGDVCTQIAFVTSGCLRQYTVDLKGDEHILQFAIADWWISDLHSFLSAAPSTQTIDALADSEILVLERSERERLFEKVPRMERFFRLLLESNYVATHKRVAESLSESAERRYLAFIRDYSALLDHIPQNQIASYLGITPQSLSRIRKSLADGGRR